MPAPMPAPIPAPMRPSTLRNLGPACDDMLAAAGIHTVEQLEELGSVEAFVRVKQALGRGVSRVLLYAIEAALLDVHWNELPPDVKADRVAEAERRLAQVFP